MLELVGLQGDRATFFQDRPDAVDIERLPERCGVNRSLVRLVDVHKHGPDAADEEIGGRKGCLRQERLHVLDQSTAIVDEERSG